MQENQHMLWRLENAGTYLIMGSTTQTNLGRCMWYLTWVLSFMEHQSTRHCFQDLTNQIVGVLLRFRKEQVVVTGDIEAMYHEVKVPENQKCFLWFLWWKDSDSSKVFVDHEMTAECKDSC